MRPVVAGQEKRTGEQQGEHLLPAVLGKLRDRRDVLKAGIGNHRVEASEALQGLGHRLRVCLTGAEIGDEIDLTPNINPEHVPTVAGQALRDGGADPARRPGDHRGPPHVGVPFPGVGISPTTYPPV